MKHINEYKDFEQSQFIVLLLFDYARKNNLEMFKNSAAKANTSSYPRALKFATEYNSVDVVKYLVEELGQDITRENNRAIKKVAEFGHSETLKYLLTLDEIDEGARNEAFQNAATYTKHNALKVLVEDPKVNVMIDNNSAFNTAISYCDEEMFDILFPHVDPSQPDDRPLRTAIQCNNEHIVNKIATDKRVNPAAHDNKLLKWAISIADLGIVEKILKDERVDPNAGISQSISSDSPDMLYVLLKSDKVNKEELIKKHFDNQMLMDGIIDVDPKYREMISDYQILFKSGFINEPQRL